MIEEVGVGGAIAIVAAACRFPDASSPEKFWDNLMAGRSSIGSAPPERFRAEGAARFGAFLDNIRSFDAGFFGMSAEEAAVTDPQQRILLEVAHEALERTGLAGPLRRGRCVGVFVGVGQSDYQEVMLPLVGKALHPAAAIGNLRNLIAARIAHVMNLSGPALAVDTACSSSLMALQLACESLRRRECDVALACGVTLNLTPTVFVTLARAGALSPTGRCRPFARDADGIALGEGVGAVVLERLADAQRRGAHVLAVVRGGAVNNDGRTFNPMSPKPAAQVAVMREAWRRTGLDPSTASYIEGHGTGTRLGDAIEARSVATVFGGAGRAEPLALGSVKGNVGHLLSAAGMPSLIKVALALAKRALPPSPHAAEAEPRHALAAAGIELMGAPRSWQASGPLRAGINGFGFGGTNVHVILEEAPPVPARAPRRSTRPTLWTLSAHSEAALRQSAAELAAWLDAHPEVDRSTAARSASLARDARRHRLALVGEYVAARLASWARGEAPDGVLYGLVEGESWRRTAADTAPTSTNDPHTRARRFVEGLVVDQLTDGDPDGDTDADAGCVLVPVPTYPFEHQDHWAPEPPHRPGADLGHPFFLEQASFTLDRAVLLARIGADEPLVAEHVVHGVHLLPGAACIELMRAAARHALGTEPAALLDVSFLAPARVEGTGRTFRLTVERRGDDVTVELGGNSGELLARARVARAGGYVAALGTGTDEPRPRSLAPGALYDALTARGMAHGPGLRACRSIAIGALSARAELELPESTRGRAFGLHPALLDAAIQPVAAVLLDHASDRAGLYVPLHIDAVELIGELPSRCVTLVTLHGDPRAPGETVRCEVEIATAEGDVRLRLRGLHLRKVTQASFRRGAGQAVEDGLHAIAWQDVPADAPAAPKGRWLIAPAEHPLATAVRAGLQSVGARCEPIAVIALAGALAMGETEGIVYLGELGPPPTIETVEAVDASQCQGVLSLLAVARSIDSVQRAHWPRRLLVVTAGATDGSLSERSTTVGLASALAGELPGICSRVLDLPVGAGAEAVVDAVLAEAGRDGDEIVRIRSGRRERRVVVPLDDASPAAAALRDDGVYLITGGAEGIGFAIARSLARQGRTLVLIGRTPLDRAPERGARIEELRASGAAVAYVSCDVADPDGVAGLIAELVHDHGAVHGVVHAAGVVEPGRIGARDAASFSRVMAAKVRGTWLLWRELDRWRQRPDFVALCSSVSASLPGLGGGLGAYVAANAYLDAFAQARRAEGLPFTSIAWSVWSETGMGTDPALLRAMEARGLPGISTAAGVEAFHRVLALGHAHVLVAPGPASPRPAAHRRIARPAAERSVVPLPAADFEAEICTLVARALSVAPSEVPTRRSFLAMGLDSLTALELVQVLEDRHGIELPSTLFFEHQTAEALAVYLVAATGRTRVATTREPVVDGGVRPLSPTQLAFYLNHRLYPDVTAYSFLRQTVDGPVSAEALQRAAQLLARRHPLLRGFVDATEVRRPLQRIAAQVEVRLTDHGRVADVEALADRVINAPFDLARPPLWRVDLACDADGRSHVLLCAHHLIADAWSLHVLALDLWRAYAAHPADRLTTAPPAPMPALVASVPDPTLATSLAWWRPHLADLPRLELPWDGDPDAPPGGPLTAVTVRLDAEQTGAFARAAANANVSTFQLSLAAYARCLARWTGSAEVVINVARARRDLRRPAMAEAVGCFADTLPLRLRVTPQDSLAAVAARARGAMVELERHGEPTSVDIAALLRGGRGGPRVASPASYSFARFRLTSATELPVITETAGRTASAATRLGLAAWEFRDELCFSWNFSESLFRRETVARLADELLREHVAAGQDATGSSAGATAADRSLRSRIVERLRTDPERIALIDGGREVTCAELDRSSGAVAAALTARGLGRGEVVGLVADQGMAGVAALVGILRAGAAWLPLDPEHPPARLRDQLARAGVRACLFAPEGAPLAQALAGLVEPLLVSDLTEAAGEPPTVASVADSDLAYVLFTSGSTGRPKGVPILHGAIRTYLDWAIACFGYGPDDVLLGTASLCFDASVRQVLAPLLCGARLVTCSRALARDPEGLLAVMVRERVTVFSSVPSLLARLLRLDVGPLGQLRWLKLGGEALPPGLVRALFDRLDPPPTLVNLYGPTETTINATWHVVRERPGDDDVRVPIGRPVGGATVQVLDDDGRACPAGSAGELHVGGTGLSPGYLGEPELTARAFVRSSGGARLYCTGDRALMRPDGVLEVLGRIDDQVKVHGHRIEPGEIETVLSRHPGVALVAVRAVGDEPERRLEAWIEPCGPTPPVSELQTLLREYLPEYMWPRRFHVVDAMPVTIAGKVDRSALSPAESPPSQERGGSPSGPIEREVARVFAEVLRVPAVGRDDDFFDLGGDSIGVLEVFTRLDSSVAALPRAATLYQQRTVRRLAAAIDAHARGASGDAALPLAAGGAGEPWFALSPTQRGFVLARAVDPGASVQWAARIALEGPLDHGCFREATRILFDRHSMLRAVIDLRRRPPAQRVLDPREPPLELVSHCDRADADRRWSEARRQPLDPGVAPPVRLQLLSLSATRHELLVCADHLIGDALSGWILALELLRSHDALARGQAPELPVLRSCFRTFVERVREFASAEDLAYWQRTFEDPYDPPRAWYAPEASGPARCDATLEPARVDALQRAAARGGATVYELVLAAWVHALRELTGQGDLVVGTALAGRDAPVPDIGRLFGPFATALPVRVRAGEPGIMDSLEAARRAFADARAHALPAGDIARALPGGTPFEVAAGIQLFFTFMDFEALGALTGEHLRVDWSDSETDGDVPRSTDLQLSVRRLGGALQLGFHAAAHALGPAGLARLRDRVLALLDELAGERTVAQVGERADRAPRFGPIDPRGLDAALIGYLPSPSALAALAGLAQGEELREALRAQLFPEARPRWLERLETRLGSSGLLCLPLFADELVPARADEIAERVAEAMVTISSHGIRGVSLAGMLPARTGYGHAVLARRRGVSGTELTTGHATTVVAVVRTVLAATGRAGIDLAGAGVAFVGVGSIGGAVAELLLHVVPHPRRVILCDLQGASRRVQQVAESLRSGGFLGSLEQVASGSALPDEVYEARLIVGAASSAQVLDVARLRPGTVVVDDSFPHIFDPAQARARMHGDADVLLVGGGLLDCGTMLRTIDVPAALAAVRPAILRSVARAGIASCQLEPLLRRASPELHPTIGLVGAEAARRAWDAAERCGIRAAPLHLGSDLIPDDLLAAGQVRGLRAELD